MIKIKLKEFNVSAQDLDQQRLLFFQKQADIFPITNLNITNQALILSFKPEQPIMNLTQFQLQTKTANPELVLYFKQNPNLRIFGYRLENNLIIFG